MEWTDESITRLRALWQEGLSTAEIGRRMGITKNAVVGKAHRLDLAARPSPIRKPDALAGAQQVNAQPKRPAAAAEKPRAAEVVTAEQPIAAPIEPAVAPVAASAPVETAPVEEIVQPEPAMVAEAQVEPVAVQPEPAALLDNVRLLRPEMPNPAVASVSSRAEAEPVRAEAPRAAPRPAEPREPRRRGLTCCWPLGEPGTKGFHFCGGDPTPGKPYCAEHAALAYVKLRDRRDSVA